MKLTFIGAAQEVTGSCFLVETGTLRFLVDCGMFQGGSEARARNLQAWTFDPRQVDFVLLTHAHIDHSGLLPRLCALGFRGSIITTHATADLLAVMLLDSAHIQETDWARAQRKNHRQRKRAGAPAPLYTVAQAQACLEQLSGVAYDEDVRPDPGLRCRFRDAGHILGSASLELWVTEGKKTTKLVFSGDLGQPGRPIVRDPTTITHADVLLVESTYGDRLHRSLKDTVDELVEVIGTTTQRKGNTIIPAFALGRTQEVIWLLADLCRQGRLPRLTVFVDSPMATKATDITWRHKALLDAETQAYLLPQDTLSQWIDLHFTQTVEESVALNAIQSGAIIISASGMCDAGRIKHHLSHNLGRPECAIVIIGFQAAGTLGRKLVDGVKRVRIFGEEHVVRAHIHTIGGLSAHADQAALLGWLQGFTHAPRRTFVVHGEAQTARGFADRIAQTRGWKVEVPAPGTQVDL
ncbi:MBL fold metallo-hydrolase RNA specificity domain-containing protein [Rhodoferax sp. WC2427]|uniref:MBL fold metallo-hydrolase RNA specificity domain-containing protein n=1 Tax=Rhodoferax sp. WC2427 TaxID=3234144 RepID=UPI00346542C1